MALNPAMMKALCERIIPGARVAAMGYPDLDYPKREIEKLLGAKIYQLKYREDSEAICKRHGLAPQKIPDAASLFGLLGATLDVFDIVENRGGEIICDLNYPLDEKHAQKYDFVLDVGTLEHCFNIAQAAVNMAGLVKEDGTIFHENPFLMGNHGFYSLNPTFYADFYAANGFNLLFCQMVSRTEMSTNIPPTGRFLWERGDTNILAYARRDAILPFVYPTQAKYRNAPDLLGQRVPPTLQRALGA